MATHNTQRWTIGIASDLAVVGYDYENADMDRPHGEIIREVYYLQATNDRGDRREFGGFDSLEAAEADIVFAPPVLLWSEGRPEYGSRAWQLYGEADQMESEARQVEAEGWGFDTRFSIF